MEELLNTDSKVCNIFDKEVNRLYWVDIFKGIATILMVIGHIIKDCPITHDWIYSFHMPAFFFASGWLYKNRDNRSCFKKRFYTLMIPYFVFGSLTLLYWEFVEKQFRETSSGFCEAFYGLMYGHYSTLIFASHFWFLPALFFMTVFYNFIKIIFRDSIVYLVAVLMCILYVFFSFNPLPWGGDEVFKFIVFFALGDLCSQCEIYSKIAKLKRLVIACIGIFLMVLNFMLAYYKCNVELVWYLTAIMGIFGLTFISIGINRNIILEYIGKISLVVLCVHGIVYRIIVTVIAKIAHMDLKLARANFITVNITLIVTLFVCSVAYQIITTYIPFVIGLKVNSQTGRDKERGAA